MPKSLAEAMRLAEEAAENPEAWESARSKALASIAISLSLIAAELPNLQR